MDNNHPDYIVFSKDEAKLFVESHFQFSVTDFIKWMKINGLLLTDSGRNTKNSRIKNNTPQPCYYISRFNHDKSFVYGQTEANIEKTYLKKIDNMILDSLEKDCPDESGSLSGISFFEREYLLDTVIADLSVNEIYQEVAKAVGTEHYKKNEQAVKDVLSFEADILPDEISQDVVFLQNDIKEKRKKASNQKKIKDNPYTESDPGMEITGEDDVDEDPIEELNQLIGLQAVKDDVNKLVKRMQVKQLRKQRGLPELKISMHQVFVGNPGTGKTTVARILARIYKKIGALSKGQLITCQSVRVADIEDPSIEDLVTICPEDFKAYCLF